MPGDVPPPQPDLSYYIAGGTLPRDASSYVTRRADQDLYASLGAGEYCYVLNSRQMGKSSLMVRTADRLKADGATVAVLDLTAIGQNLTPEQWYDGLLDRLGRQVDLEDELEAFYRENPKLSPLQRFFQAIERVVLPVIPVRLILFVDEIDVVRSLPFTADEFFAGIRHCFVGRSQEPILERLAVCLLGTATPADLIQDTRTSPFNIGRRIEIKDFTQEEAWPLARGLGSSGHALLTRVLHWTGGHPYLTQRLCRALAEARASTASDVDRLCAELYLTHTARESDDNLSFVRNRLLKSEADLAGLLDIYDRVRRGGKVADDETNPLTSVLKLSGVARVERGRLRVRNRIYDNVFDRQWVLAHMPDAELRRQQSAFRRGLLLAGGVGGVVILALTALSLYALDQRHTAQVSASRADREKRAAKIARTDAERLAKDLAGALNQARTAQKSALQQKSAADKSAANARHQAAIAAEAARRETGARGAESLARIAAVRSAARARGAEAVALAAKRVSDANFYASNIVLARHAIETNNLVLARRLLDQVRFNPARGPEWTYLDRRVPLQFTANAHSSPISFLDRSADGRWLASVEFSGTVKLWDAREPRQLRTFSAHKHVTSSVTLSPDGRILYTAAYDEPIRAWSVPGGKLLHVFQNPPDLPAGAAPTVSVSADGSRVCASFPETLGADGSHLIPSQIIVWDALTRKRLNVIRTAVQRAVISPDGRQIAYFVPDARAVRVIDTGSGRVLSELYRDPQRYVSQLRYSPDGRALAVGVTLDKYTAAGHGAFGPGAAVLFDTGTGREIRRQEMEGTPYSFSFSRNRDNILISCSDHVGRLWNIDSGKVVEALPDTQSCVLSADDRSVWSGNLHGGVARWDVQERLAMDRYLPGHSGPIFGMALSRDGRRLITAGADETIRVWDLSSDREIRQIHRHSGQVMSVAFTADGRRFVTGSADKTAIIWSAETLRPLHVLTGHRDQVLSTAFSPDGSLVATASLDGSVEIWDAATGKALAFQHIGILSLEFHVDKLSRPLL